MKVEKEQNPETVDLATQEPKKVLVNLVVIPLMRQIENIIAFQNPMNAVRPLEALVLALGPAAKKALAEEWTAMMYMETHPAEIMRNDMLELTGIVFDYLYTGILKEVGVQALNPKTKPFGEQ